MHTVLSIDEAKYLIKYLLAGTVLATLLVILASPIEQDQKMVHTIEIDLRKYNAATWDIINEDSVFLLRFIENENNCIVTSVE